MRIGAFVSLCLLAASAAAAEQPVDTGSGTWSLVVENDALAGTDANYTNGLYLVWLSDREAVPAWFERFARFLPLVESDSSLRRGIGLGHSIFTPSDIQAPQWPAGQQPYAGWLYGSLLAVSESGPQLNSLTINLGIVGPWALAEEVQNSYHDLIGIAEAQGWQDQLRNEPGLQILLERVRRGWWEGRLGPLALDFSPDIKLSLGNVATYLGSGAVLRLGRALGTDFGPPRIRPGLSGGAYFDNPRLFNWYIFAGVEGRVVARMIFLDGNSFRSGPSVSRRWLTGETQLGLVLQFGATQLAITGVYRLEEFKGQGRGHRFGAVSISRQF